ncbi:MoxR family ATPase [Bacillaceae bacterium]
MKEKIEAVMENVQRVIVGKREWIRLHMAALLCGGHVLLEDVPGVGKTMLIRALAKSVGCEFKRIQFTPDLLPTDITGVSIYNQKTGEFEFRPGPIMANIVLADEINRTSPKTQSALLEAMEENCITVDGVSYPLPKPFFVMATQNPLEYEGTYPLPEAQLDRFLLKLTLGYPSLKEEVAMLSRMEKNHPIETIESVLTREELLALQAEARAVYVEGSVKEYIVKISQGTREHPCVRLGVSPRGSLALFRAAQAYAYLEGRDYVIPDDVKYLAPHVLAHRLLLRPEAKMDGISERQVLFDVLEKVPVPVFHSA